MIKLRSQLITNRKSHTGLRLKKQGLGISLLDTIFKAIVLNTILYALLSRGFTPYYYHLDVLAENAQYKLSRGTLPQSPIYRKT